MRWRPVRAQRKRSQGQRAGWAIEPRKSGNSGCRRRGKCGRQHRRCAIASHRRTPARSKTYAAPETSSGAGALRANSTRPVSVIYRRRVSDDLCDRYQDLARGELRLRGSDRASMLYFSIGHSPGGFRVWWRRWHGDSDEDLDNAHSCVMAGRFSRRVRAWPSPRGSLSSTARPASAST